MYGERGGHGGGDLRLVADFCRVLRGEELSLSTTTLEDSFAGNLIGFSADGAMHTGAVQILASDQCQYSPRCRSVEVAHS